MCGENGSRDDTGGGDISIKPCLTKIRKRNSNIMVVCTHVYLHASPPTNQPTELASNSLQTATSKRGAVRAARPLTPITPTIEPAALAITLFIILGWPPAAGAAAGAVAPGRAAVGLKQRK